MPKEDLASQMASLILKYEYSGQNRKDFSEANGMSESKLDYWRAKLSKEAEDQAPDYLVIRLLSGVEIQIPM